jgi:putative methionine-R-sulfoxide reductase with GAF domain
VTIGELGKVYVNNEVIFKEGDKAEVMYVIQSGKVKISKHTSHSGDITLATLTRGDIFGEMSIFDKLPRSATATVLGEARVLSIDRKKLFQNISDDPTLAFKILETMSQRIRRLNESFAGISEAKTEMLKIFSNVDETCAMVLNEAKNMIHAENGSIMLYDENSNTLSIRAAFGTEADKKITFSAGDGIAGDVLKSGRAELVNNVAIDPRYKSGDIQIRSMLCVPVKSGGTQVGVMNMSLCSDRLFTIEDLKSLNSLTIYASMAIQNAKNFSNLKHATDKILMHATLFNS